MHSFFSSLWHKLLAADLRLFQWINHGGNQTWDPIMNFLTSADTWWSLGIGATIGILATRNRSAIFRWGFVLLCIGLSDASNTHLLKERIRRERPCHRYEAHVRLAQGYCGGRNGFPSNHASNGMAVGLSLGFLFGWKIGGIAIAIAAVVGFSRIYLGVHYPSDVLAGFSWGSFVAWAFARQFYKRLK